MSSRKKIGLEKNRCNMALRFGLRVIDAFLKRNNLWKHSQKKEEKINLFRVFHEGMDPISKKASIKWLVETWRSGQHSVLKKQPPIFGFYSSLEWISIRRKVFRKYGRICMKCGSVENIVVDHIKPRSLYPELELDFDNLQVLCLSCNSSKSNKHVIDFRNSKHKISHYAGTHT